MMFGNMSHIRLAGEPYILPTPPLQSLPPLKMKSSGKFNKKKPSNLNSVSSSVTNGSVSGTAPNFRSKSKALKTNNSKTSAASSKDTKKGGRRNNGRRNLPFIPDVVGDTAVDKLDEEEKMMDVNANVESLNEQISKDIALAVAIIVAEHEMLKLQNPGKYDKDTSSNSKKKKKLDNGKGKSTSNKLKSSSSNTAANERNREKKESKNENNVTRQDQHPPEEVPAKRQESALSTTIKETSGQNEKIPSKPTSEASASKEMLERSSQSQTLEGTASSFINVNAFSVATIPGEERQLESTIKESVKNEPAVQLVSKPPKSRVTTPNKPPSSQQSSASLSGNSSTHKMFSPPQPTGGAKTGSQLEVLKYLAKIQNYMNHLGYHRVGEPEIHINSRLSMKMQMLTAREMVQFSKPIKCLHAVVLAVHFTNCITCIERFPIYFRSHVGSKEYKHIVLGIYVQGHFGALGISRDGGLQDKPMSYSRLSDLVFEYAKCYGQSGHILNEVKFGNIITHDQHSLERLFTKTYAVPIVGCLHSDVERSVEKFAKLLRSNMGLACLKSLRMDSQHSSTAGLQSRISRSKTSLTGNISVSGGSSRSSVNIRSRALSMGPLVSFRSSSISNTAARGEELRNQPSKTVVTRSRSVKGQKPSKLF